MALTSTLAELRAELSARITAHHGSEPSFARFLAAVTAGISDEDLASDSISRLEATFRAAYGRLGQRAEDSPDLYVLAPDDDDTPQVIEVFTNETPFLADSLLAAINASGGEVTLFTEARLEFDPTTYRVLADPAPGSRRESFVHIEIRPLADEARRGALEAELHDTLADVERATRDWRPMLKRLGRVAEEWHVRSPRLAPAALAEAMHFVAWLADHHFTFLGMREYRLLGEGAEQRLLRMPDGDLGILADASVQVFRQGETWVESTPRHLNFMADAQPIIVTKTNARSRVHRRVHLDYVGIKLYGDDGQPAGELRVVGLFTASAMTAANDTIPLLRRKIADVVKRTALPPHTVRAKALAHTLDTWPRSELFQMSETELLEFAPLAAEVAARPRLCVLPRIDPFDSFVSVLVYLPRDRYDADLRIRIGEFLAIAYLGRVSAYDLTFLDPDQVRVHFIIGRQGGETPRPRREDLNRRISDLTLSFADRLSAAAPTDPDIAQFTSAFPLAYQKVTTIEEALGDIATIRTLSTDNSLALRLAPRMDWDSATRLKVYHLNAPIALSDRVPMLENFGFRVIDEVTHTITAAYGQETVLHDMLLDAESPLALGDPAHTARLEAAILAVWRGEADNDPLNRLSAGPGLIWTEVEILRALCHFGQQAGLAFSRETIKATLAASPAVALGLMGLITARFDPRFTGQRERAEEDARQALDAAIAETTALEADQIFRRLANLVDALTRTNAFQRDQSGSRRPALALKFNSRAIEGLPEPRPLREIFVHSPRLEGLHMRMGLIARGGIRWSDRPEDFRTEVLALAKAQQVKNAIIVPRGAKGAFVPRLLTQGSEREGALCYRIFISSLLDVTDSVTDKGIVHPPDVLVRDGDDPYFVVAADKGTSGFSDAANTIAEARSCWLGDAFASGGSAGYDHKAMGITARGAWAAVKRHFRELDRDIQASPFTAVGVGDMSGDVFGNGMLLSPQLRLVAAFDHRDIFIDPDPDPAISFAERARLFTLPRSSWQDYDPDAISKGGGVYSRSLKTVALFAEARRVLGLGSEPVSPNDVIRAILRAEVDLIWFGGTGTYVRGSAETDAAVGDKVNDGVRVTSSELRARVIGEGANLAMTQLGRIDYALKGGRINTDAIDNSAGVNASDLEVNIKIALGPAVRKGELNRAVRDEFLASMRDEVAELCLANTVAQTRMLSIESFRAADAAPEHIALIEALEATGELSRRVDRLPENGALSDRARFGQGLTRPELAQLLAHAKNQLQADLLDDHLPVDPFLGRELFRYFPPRLREAFATAISTHQLRPEIIATVLANGMINAGGPAFANELQLATSAAPGAIALAYLAARDVFSTPKLEAEIDALDGQVPGRTQLLLYRELQRTIRRAALWFLRNGRLEGGVQSITERHAQGLAEVKSLLPGLLTPRLEAGLAARSRALEAEGVSPVLASRFAELASLAFAPDIMLVAERLSRPLPDAAASFFGVLDLFGLGTLADDGHRIVLTDRFDRLALDRALANLLRAQRDICADVLSFTPGPMPGNLNAWRNSRLESVARASDAVARLATGEITVSRLSVAAGLLSDLARGA